MPLDKTSSLEILESPLLLGGRHSFLSAVVFRCARMLKIPGMKLGPRSRKHRAALGPLAGLEALFWSMCKATSSNAPVAPDGVVGRLSKERLGCTTPRLINLPLSGCLFWLSWCQGPCNSGAMLPCFRAYKGRAHTKGVVRYHASKKGS